MIPVGTLPIYFYPQKKMQVLKIKISFHFHHEFFRFLVVRIINESKLDEKEKKELEAAQLFHSIFNSFVDDVVNHEICFSIFHS